MNGRHTALLERLSLRQKIAVVLVALGVLAGAVAIPTAINAEADIVPTRQTVKGSDGKDYWVENHVDPSALKASEQAAQGIGTRPEYLIVWAGDENAADTAVGTVKNLPGSLANPLDSVRNAAPGPDFMAVIDATKGSPRYGEVVNTATVGPLVENEPHHMQYIWHKGNKIYAGGLFTAATYVFDVENLPKVSLSGVSLPSQTKCGSVPDAYWVNEDGTAYGTYMGGPVAPGPCRYTNGEVRSGNGFGGSPGEVVKFDEEANVVAEAPAATVQGEDPAQCANLPRLSKPTCANPHGIQVREDLDTIVTSDYAEPRNIILDPVKAPSPNLRRTTVRTWDISDPDHPKVRSVKYLPVGPRSPAKSGPLHNENRAVMETTVTKQPGNKGAFAMTMQGGAIFYTPDMTAKDPVWTEVYDLDAAVKEIDPRAETGAGLNGGWLEVSPDDKTLYHAVMGRQPGALGKDDPGTAGGVVALDITKLLAAGTKPSCSIETDAQRTDPGGTCPTLRSALPINPGETAGGPHWGALDNLEMGDDGFYRETESPTRLSTANYFVGRTGLDGDHRVCMVDVNDGDMSLDREFTDENTGEPCVDFNRADWPHGPFGNAKPHSQLFVTADRDIK